MQKSKIFPSYNTVEIPNLRYGKYTFNFHKRPQGLIMQKGFYQHIGKEEKWKNTINQT